MNTSYGSPIADARRYVYAGETHGIGAATDQRKSRVETSYAMPVEVCADRRRGPQRSSTS